MDRPDPASATPAAGARGEREPSGLDPALVVVDPATVDPALGEAAERAAEHQAQVEAMARERVAIAAYAGHGPSRSALGADAPRQPHTVDAWLIGLADWDMTLVPIAGLALGELALRALERERPADAAPWRRRVELARAFVEAPTYDHAVALVEATRDGPRLDEAAPATARAVELACVLALEALGARYLTELHPLVNALVATTVEAGVDVPTLARTVGEAVTAAVLGDGAS